MDVAILTSLLEVYGEDRKFKKDAYYSIKKNADDKYEFERTVSGPCGESIAAPSIKVNVQNGKLIPIQLTDFQATPIRLWREEKAQEISVEFEKLIQQFQENR